MNSEHFLKWLDRNTKRGRLQYFERPLVMGVLNVTPDSFADGGKFLSLDKAYDQAMKLVEEGADVIDVGGESTRPGASAVPLDEELARVIPVIEKIRSQSEVSISIDTYKPAVMRAAVGAGANLINDVYALRQPGALDAAAALGVPICLMHMQGQPHTMQENPDYPRGIRTDLHEFFGERIAACEEAGISKTQLIIDPGFGFGKTVSHNLELIYHLDDFKPFNLPILLGVSRKHTVGEILKKEVKDRLIGSITLAVYVALKGVGILRTHDVDETNQALTMIDAVYQVGQDK